MTVPGSAPWSRHVAEKRPAIVTAEPVPPPLLADREPIRYPAAFCAPGTETIAAITLWLNGEHVASIHASRMLEGSDRVLVIAEPPELLPSRESLLVEPRDAGPDALGFTWREEMRLRMRVRMSVPHPVRLSSVVVP